jgi:hypothetical protein
MFGRATNFPTKAICCWSSAIVYLANLLVRSIRGIPCRAPAGPEQPTKHCTRRDQGSPVCEKLTFGAWVAIRIFAGLGF